MSDDKIKTIIMDKLGVDESKITMDSNFINDLGADSLDQIELIMQLEEEFDIEISDEEAETLTTVQKVYDFLKDK
tara:strand:- start:252 stop:476 length:225 start_codon:yes stop_codon:yes gene_type:complete